MTLSTAIHKYFGTPSRIFSSIVRLIFLIVSLIFFWSTIAVFIDYDTAVEDLVPHNGVLETIEPLEHWEKRKKIIECKLSLQNDANEYMTNHTINELTQDLNIGDTISIYTKEKVLGFTNFRVNGNSVNWPAPDNEIYHLVRNQDQVVIDLQKHRDGLAPALFMLPIVAIICLIIFLGKLPFRSSFTTS